VNLNDIPVHSEEVVSRVIDGEAVLVHAGQRRVRVLNPVGARLWELADGEHTAGAAAEIVAAEYGADLARVNSDALAFFTDLIDRGVLSISHSN
jgi:hypothetical protein